MKITLMDRKVMTMSMLWPLRALFSIYNLKTLPEEIREIKSADLKTLAEGLKEKGQKKM